MRTQVIGISYGFSTRALLLFAKRDDQGIVVVYDGKESPEQVADALRLEDRSDQENLKTELDRFVLGSGAADLFLLEGSAGTLSVNAFQQLTKYGREKLIQVSVVIATVRPRWFVYLPTESELADVSVWNGLMGSFLSGGRQCMLHIVHDKEAALAALLDHAEQVPEGLLGQALQRIRASSLPEVSERPRQVLRDEPASNLIWLCSEGRRIAREREQRSA